MKGRRLAVVTTMYNAAAYIAEAISSILRQTYEDFTYILVDDESTDHTMAIVEELAKCDDRISVVTIRHAGIAAAANAGCLETDAEYIARLDADDIAVADRLERQLRVLDKRPDVAMIGGAMQLMTSDGTRLQARVYPTSPEQIRATLQRRNCIQHSTVTMRRSMLSRVGGYRRYFEPSEDYDLWLRISEVGKIMNLPDVLVMYRIHEFQASFRMIDQQALGAIAARASRSFRVDFLRYGSRKPSELASYSSLRAEGISDADILREMLAHYCQAIEVAQEITELGLTCYREQLLMLQRRHDELTGKYNELLQRGNAV